MLQHLNENQYQYIEAIAVPFYDIIKIMMKGPNKQSNIKKTITKKWQDRHDKNKKDKNLSDDQIALNDSSVDST